MVQTVFLVFLLITSSIVHGGSCFDAEPDFNDCKVKAGQGDTKAQYNLGQMYRRGEGVAQDYKEAVQWYGKAVEQRDARARYWLGVMSARGQGASEEDIKERRKRREQAEQRSKKGPRMAVGVYSKGQEGKQALQPNGITNKADRNYVILKADHRGHFRGVVLINNKEANFLIDTGASFLSVPEDLAWKAHLRKGKKIIMNTASGRAYAYKTTIKKLKIGIIELKDVDAVIVENLDSQVLIGMSVLKQFKITQDSGSMLIDYR